MIIKFKFLKYENIIGKKTIKIIMEMVFLYENFFNNKW